MDVKSSIRQKLFIFLCPLLVVIDQLSKHIIRQEGGFYVCNPGIAFGIKISAVVLGAFWVVIVIAVISEMALALKREPRPGIFWPESLILAGAFSNMIDRLASGCVTDFIDLKVWPVFNLADAFIVLGALLWLAKSRKI